MSSADKTTARNDEMPDLVGWLAGPAYKAMTATAQYIAAYAAVAIANVLAPSFFLYLLKNGLMVTFLCRAGQLAVGTSPGQQSHWFLTVLKFASIFILAGFAIVAANDVFEAGLVQLDSSRAEKAVAAERLSQSYRREGIRHGCYDPDLAAITPACQFLERDLREKLRALEQSAKKPASAERKTAD